MQQSFRSHTPHDMKYVYQACLYTKYKASILSPLGSLLVFACVEADLASCCKEHGVFWVAPSCCTSWCGTRVCVHESVYECEVTRKRDKRNCQLFSFLLHHLLLFPAKGFIPCALSQSLSYILSHRSHHQFTVLCARLHESC